MTWLVVTWIGTAVTLRKRQRSSSCTIHGHKQIQSTRALRLVSRLTRQNWTRPRKVLIFRWLHQAVLPPSELVSSEPIHQERHLSAGSFSLIHLRLPLALPCQAITFIQATHLQVAEQLQYTKLHLANTSSLALPATFQESIE